MKTKIAVVTAVLTLSMMMTAGFAKAQSSASGAVPILQFSTMAPVSGPYVQTSTNKNTIRGILGGGLPWKISSASGELLENGTLKIRTQGLVFAAGPNTGKNTIPYFRAAVSCRSISSNGMPEVVNLWTGTFPADSMGNATINAKVSLPDPCIAPIVFVTSPTGLWFAATGH